MPAYRFLSLGLTALVFLTFAACLMKPGSYSKTSSGMTEKMYRYEEGGKKTLVYEVDNNGKLIVHDPNDTQAQQRLAQQKREQESEQKLAARMERIKQAPKRKPNDPITVFFLSIESDMEMTDKQKKDMFDYIEKQLEGDPVIQLMTREKGNSKSGQLRQAASTLKTMSSGKPVSDMDLLIKVSSETVYGITEKGKPAEAKALVFNATMTGNWIPVTQNAKESGTLFQLPEATKRLSDKIRKLIKDDIGQTIPADKSL